MPEKVLPKCPKIEEELTAPFEEFCRGIKCIFLSIESVSEAREGGEEDVGMPGVGVVGDRGPRPSP